MKIRSLQCVAVMLACVMPLAAGCGGDGGPQASLAVMGAADIGQLETSPIIRGRDGGYSGRFEGHSVWLYGDTALEAPDAQGRTWLNNSWSYTDDTDAADGVTGFLERPDSAQAPQEFFPLTDEERQYNDAHYGDPCAQEPCGARWAMWPGSLVYDAEGARALVFYGKIHAAPGDFNFYGVGHSLAVWSRFEDAPVRPVVRAQAAEPTLLFQDDEPAFGSGAFIAEGYLYAYACELDGFDKPCKLARVLPAQALQRDAWSFFAGGGAWSADVRDAKAVFNGSDMVTVYWNTYLGCYLAVYSQPMDAVTRLRTAPRPEGPWSRAVTAFRAQKPEGGGWVYDAVAHPEFDLDGGRVIHVTYSRSTGFLQGEFRVVRVELGRVEPEER